MRSLFEPSVEPTRSGVVARPYQVDAIDAVEVEHTRVRSTFVVMPTGCGKTITFILMARRAIEQGKRVLIIVDRHPLINQTIRSVLHALGYEPTVEQGDRFGGHDSKVVVGMIQSLVSDGRGFEGGRYSYYNPNDFGLVIVDECHLSITPSYRSVLSHFKQNQALRIVGFTATPSRSDRQSMRQLYESCAYRYEIRDAIDDGWLVPIDPYQVTIESLDLSRLPLTGRDWTDDQIGELMEQHGPLFEVCGTLLERCFGQPTLVFGARVSHIAMMTAQLNAQRPNCARWIADRTPPDERQYILDEFSSGRIDFLLNVAVLSVGFDAPNVRNVAIARPMRTWTPFVQCVGRGTRPLPGVVDGIDDPQARREAIASSTKPNLCVLSFADRSAGVDLVGPEDVLAGSMRKKEVVRRAKELRDTGDTIEDRLDRAEREIERERMEMEAAPVSVRVKSRARSVDLFRRGQGDAGQEMPAGAATEAQVRRMRQLGIEPSIIRKYSADKRAAGKVLGTELALRRNGRATWKQRRVLQGRGYRKDYTRSLSIKEASALISGGSRP